MRIQTREEMITGAYRKIKAMYRQGYSASDISRATGLEQFEVLDIMQNLYAKSRRN